MTSREARSRITAITDALGFVTTFEYDNEDRVTKVIDAEGNPTTYEYDDVGNITASTNARRVRTTYVYDANYNLTSMTDAAGTTSYTYDALNRVTGVTDRRGNTQWFGYDAIGRIVRVRDKNSNLTQYTYDGNGNIVQTTDALGTVARFTYNLNDQLVKMDLNRVDPIHETDTHEITLYEYDGRNLITKEINALGDATLYVYDGNGNLVSKADPDGYVTEYSYSPLDLVSNINYNGGKQASFAYNKAGELVKMDDWTGTNTFELDLLGQLKKATDHKGNVVQYTYDGVGNVIDTVYPNGDTVTNKYDEVYNLTKVYDPEGKVHTYIYDDADRPVEQIYPNGWIEENTYDPEGNLLTVYDTDPFQIYNKEPRLKFEYRYDAEGNVTYQFKRDTDATDDLKSHTTYTYDALNRLSGSARNTEGYPNGNQSHTYTYDTLGNLVREVGPTQRDIDTYTYNDLNQMVHQQECGYIESITRIHNYGYTYDKRGNLVKEEEICAPTTQGPKLITVAEYTYDETNRMVMGTNELGEASLYTYNGLGVRVGTELILQDNTHGYTDFHCETPSVSVPATGPHGPEVVKSDYVIDYNRLNIDQRVLLEHEIGGYDFRYVYGLDKVQRKITSEGSDWWGQTIHECVDMSYVHTDRLGSVVNLSDEFGRVYGRSDYSDWGEVRAYVTTTVDQGFRVLMPEVTFAGHEYDDVLNQFYAKYRMYDADLRRFDSVDPVKGSIPDPLSLVQYLYVQDNPLRWVDPLGLDKYELDGKSIESINIDGRVDRLGNPIPYVKMSEILEIYGASKFYKGIDQSGQKHDVYYSHILEDSEDPRSDFDLQFIMDDTAGILEIKDRNQNLVAKVSRDSMRIPKQKNDDKLPRINYASEKIAKVDGSNYVDLRYFVQLMCDLGYSINYSKLSSEEQYIQNLKRNFTIATATKMDTMVVMAQRLLKDGYKVAFVAGVLANIYYEANLGKFESSNYDAHPDVKPNYLKYMDANYSYRQNYSGQYITDSKSLSALHALLLELKPKDPSQDWTGKFGLGSVQWTADRALTLTELYMQEAGSSDTITKEQAIKAETKMISQELAGSYSSVYTNWLAANPNFDSGNAAIDAARRICLYYEKPKDKEAVAEERAPMGKIIYDAMING